MRRGVAQARAENILIVLETRGIDVPDSVRERVTCCEDCDISRNWLIRAVTAASAADIFTEPEDET